MTVKEAQKLMKAANSEPLEALWMFGMALGLRRGEALGVKWEDVDLAKGRLVVRTALQRQNKQGLVAVEPKSKTSRRTLPLPPFVVTSLKRHLKRQKAQRLAVGPDWHESGYVFVREDGRPMSPEVLFKEFKAFLTRAEVRDVRFHDLRHTCASLLFHQGCSLRLVMEILGHSRIGLTAETYTHLLPEADREASRAMEALLASKG